MFSRSTASFTTILDFVPVFLPLFRQLNGRPHTSHILEGRVDLVYRFFFWPLHFIYQVNWFRCLVFTHSHLLELIVSMGTQSP